MSPLKLLCPHPICLLGALEARDKAFAELILGQGPGTASLSPAIALWAPIVTFPAKLRCKQNTMVHLQCACHPTKPEMQATATLLALTDPRGDKYVCLLLCE